MTGFREKPTFKLQASTGIYCMEPQILDLILTEFLLIDDLMYTMLEQKLPVYITGTRTLA